MHCLVICQLTFNLKIFIKSEFDTYLKSLDTKPINCVGVQIFKHLELKFTNVGMLKIHIYLCSMYNYTYMTFLTPMMP